LNGRTCGEVYQVSHGKVNELGGRGLKGGEEVWLRANGNSGKLR